MFSFLRLIFHLVQYLSLLPFEPFTPYAIKGSLLLMWNPGLEWRHSVGYQPRLGEGTKIVQHLSKQNLFGVKLQEFENQAHFKNLLFLDVGVWKSCSSIGKKQLLLLKATYLHNNQSVGERLRNPPQGSWNTSSAGTMGFTQQTFPSQIVQSQISALFLFLSPCKLGFF